MAKIIEIDSYRKKAGTGRQEKEYACMHKQVIASTLYRTVRCGVCGTDLDPFDVLMDMLKMYVPPDSDDREQRRLLKEVARRSRKKI